MSEPNENFPDARWRTIQLYFVGTEREAEEMLAPAMRLMCPFEGEGHECIREWVMAAAPLREDVTLANVLNLLDDPEILSSNVEE